MSDPATSDGFKKTVQDKWDHAARRLITGDQPPIEGLLVFTDVRKFQRATGTHGTQ